MGHTHHESNVMTKHADIMFAGQSGERYCFQTWPLRTQFRPLGAVYFVTRRVFANATFRRARHEVIYIGETASMSNPLGTQSQLDAFEKHGANCVCVYPASDEAYRTNMVTDLMASQNPLLVR